MKVKSVLECIDKVNRFWLICRQAETAVTRCPERPGAYEGPGHRGYKDTAGQDKVLLIHAARTQEGPKSRAASENQMGV